MLFRSNVVSDIECVCKSDVIIDALFGTGLKRAIEGSLADVISAVIRRKRNILSE